MMIERIMLLAGITLVLIMILTLLKKQQLKQAQSAAQSVTTNNPCNTKPQLIYFWSTQCSQCKSIQAPIVDNLASVIGKDKLTVSKYNINESPEQAINWGVKTVPTIYLLDRAGKIQHINNGLTTERTLIEQIEILVA